MADKIKIMGIESLLSIDKKTIQNKSEYKSCEYYFKFIPIELSAGVISCLYSKQSILAFKDLLTTYCGCSSEVLISHWKLNAGDNYYNPETCSVINHPLVKNLFNVFKKLMEEHEMDTSFHGMKLIKEDKWLIFYDTRFPKDFQNPYVTIDPETLEIYGKPGKNIRGSLIDSKDNGIYLIDQFGVITNPINQMYRDGLRINTQKKIREYYRKEDMKSGKYIRTWRSN